MWVPKCIRDAKKGVDSPIPTQVVSNEEILPRPQNEKQKQVEHLAVENPLMAQHLIAKNVKHYGSDHVIWGTDCLWWGSPQWAIDLFKRFQISDELCEKFGYKKLTKQDKANIFGLNAARLYKVDVKAKRNALPADTIEKFKKRAFTDTAEVYSNNVMGWVRADD